MSQHQCPNCGAFRYSDADFEAKSCFGWLFYAFAAAALFALFALGFLNVISFEFWGALVGLIACAFLAVKLLSAWKSEPTRLQCDVCGKVWEAGATPSAPITPNTELIEKAAADEAARRNLEELEMLRRQATGEYPFDSNRSSDE